MDQTLFRGEMEGLVMEQLIRDGEYSMARKHLHATYEIYYLVEGERYYFIDSRTYRIKAGDLVLVGPDHIHRTSQAGALRHNRILLLVSGEMIGRFLKDCGLGTMEELFGEGVGVWSLKGEDQVMARDVFRRIQEELRRKQWRYQAVVRLELARLLFSLARCGRPEQKDEGSQTAQGWKQQKVQEVAAYLTRHPETGESLAELAQRFYVSKSYLSRIFKEITGFTVNEYKNLSRVKRAQELLTQGTGSVTEIAASLGFENLPYFDRVFKKYAETTPFKYRKSRT